MSSGLSTPTRNNSTLRSLCSSLNSTPTRLYTKTPNITNNNWRSPTARSPSILSNSNTLNSNTSSTTIDAVTVSKMIFQKCSTSKQSKIQQATITEELTSESVRRKSLHQVMSSVYGEDSGLEILTCADIKELVGLKVPSHNDTWWCILEFRCQEVRESSDDLVIMFSSSGELQHFLRLLEKIWRAKNVSTNWKLYIENVIIFSNYYYD